VKTSLCLLVLLCLCFCRKPEKLLSLPVNSGLFRGVPTSGTANGVLVAVNVVARYPGYKAGESWLLAFFSDPDRSLYANFDRPLDAWGFSDASAAPNITVGIVNLNGMNVGPVVGNNFAYYHISRTGHFTGPAIWKSEGNRDFWPLDVTINEPFAAFRDTAKLDTVRIHSGHRIASGELFRDYDSLTVYIGASGHPHVVKRCSACNEIVFSPESLQGLKPNSYGSVYVMASRFFYRFINGRLFVFECISQLKYRAVIQE
jgi:hypothetical protein